MFLCLVQFSYKKYMQQNFLFKWKFLKHCGQKILQYLEKIRELIFHTDQQVSLFLLRENFAWIISELTNMFYTASPRYLWLALFQTGGIFLVIFPKLCYAFVI